MKTLYTYRSCHLSFSFLEVDFHYRVFLTAFTGKDEIASKRPLCELRIFVSHSVFGAGKTLGVFTHTGFAQSCM